MILLLVWSLIGNGKLDEGPAVANATVIPLAYSSNTLAVSGESIWVQVRYSGEPDGEILFVEASERVWWLQDQPFLLLGSTGLPLPTRIARRTTVWIEVDDGEEVFGPVELFPRRDGVSISADPSQVLAALSQGVVGVDASYLAQVAHYMVGHLGFLDVLGSSFSVDNYGPVINNQGEWVGDRLLTKSAGGSVFVGDAVGHSDDGSQNLNTGVGDVALNENTSGFFNVAIGARALQHNVQGNNNVAVGNSAMINCDDGTQNVAIGSGSSYDSTTGSYNTAVGYRSLFKNTAYKNTALGRHALYANTTGEGNTSVGWNTMAVNLTGSNNTAIGLNALNGSVSGSDNTALGADAGPNDLSFNLSNTTSIGHGATTTASNQVRVGNNVSSIGGEVGWSTVSDARFKRDLRDNVPGLAFIKELRPVSYRLDRAALQQFVGKSPAPLTTDDADVVESGFVAQEVQAAAQSVGFTFSGVDVPANDQTPFALRYGHFVVPLVKAVQEQQVEIDALKSELAALRHSLVNGVR